MYDWIGKLTKSDIRLIWIGRCFPRFVVLAVCFVISRILFRFACSLRRRVMGNMQQLLKEVTASQARKYGKAYFLNLCLTLYEILLDSPDRDGKRFQIEGEAALDEVLKAGKGAILFSPHMGNFFYYYWYLSQKYRCITVVTAESKELRPIYLRFQQLGCVGLDYDATPPLELMRTLRKHVQQNGVVFLLGDFFRPQFPQATLFDRITRCPGGTAALALELQVPVIPFFGHRTRGFRHRLVFDQPVNLHQYFERDQRTAATNLLNKTMENAVVSVPEQWFYWFNSQERWESEDQDLRKGAAHEHFGRWNRVRRAGDGSLLVRDRA